MPKILEQIFRNSIGDAVYGMHEYNADDFHDALDELAGRLAEDVTIYHGDCLDIIHRYGNDERTADAEGLTGGATYTAFQWQEAAHAWAAAVALSVLSHEAGGTCGAVERAEAALRSVAGSLGAQGRLPVMIGTECPFSLLAHD